MNRGGCDFWLTWKLKSTGVGATLGSQKISSNCSTSSHAACLSGWTPSRCFPHKCWSLNNFNDNENDNDNNQWTWDKQSASVDETLLGVRCWWFCWLLENYEELIKAMPMMEMIVTDMVRLITTISFQMWLIWYKVTYMMLLITTISIQMLIVTI